MIAKLVTRMSQTIEIDLFAQKQTSQDQLNGTEGVESSPWLISISIDAKATKTIKKLRNPFNKDQEDKCRWYIQDFATKWPFHEKKAADAVKELKGYANSLFIQLDLVQLIHDTVPSSSSANRCITINITEDEGAVDSIQQLHWELLESSSHWGPEFEITIRRVTKAMKGDGNYPVNELALDEDHVSGQSRVNVLLVVARDLSPNPDTTDVNPNVALGILAKIQQDFASQDLQARLNLEVVRPGTLDALEEHLTRHSRGYYHFVHFDIHGTVTNSHEKKGRAARSQEGELKNKKAAYLLFNHPDPNNYERTKEKAQDVAKLLQTNGICVAILNACESARADSGDAANVAKTFTESGVQNVLAMSFEAHKSAAEQFLRGFYHSLFLQGLTFSQAARQARELLRQNPERQARLGLKRSVHDSFVPVVYSLGQDSRFMPQKEPRVGRRFSVSDFAIGSGQPAAERIPNLIGRDFDLLRLEKHLLNRGKLHFKGRAGVGKTALLRYARDLWLRTSFVDLILFVDLSKAKTSLDATKSLVSQIPVDETKRIKLRSEIQKMLDSKDFDQTSFSGLVLNACQGKAIMVIIDGVQYGQKTPFQAMPNAMPREALSSMSRFVEALLNLGSAQFSKVSVRYIMVSRLDRTTLPISENFQKSLEMDHYELPSLQLDDAVELSQLSLRNAGLDVDSWKDQDEREHNLIIGLLDGNPSAILQVMPTMVQPSLPLTEFRRRIQHGIPPQMSFPGPGQDTADEIDTMFRALNDEQRAVVILLSTFWIEAVGFQYLMDWMIEQKVCESQMSSLVIPYIQGRGLIDYEMRGKSGEKEPSDAILTWIHPMLTVYGRRASYETMVKKFDTTGKSQVLAATLVCSNLGTKFKAGTISERVDDLRKSFTSWFLAGVASTDEQRFVAALVQDLPYHKLRSFWPKQAGNLALCLAICLRKLVPVDQWPLDYFRFHVTNIRLVAFPAEIEYFAGRFEELLAIALEQGSAVPPERQLFAITSTISLNAIYTHEWPQPEKRDKYLLQALDIIEKSEEKYGVFEAGSHALYLKGVALRQAMVNHMRRGSFREAIAAGESSLEIDKSFQNQAKLRKSARDSGSPIFGAGWDASKVQEMTSRLSSMGKAPEDVRKRVEAMSSNSILDAYIESRRRILDFLKSLATDHEEGKNPEDNPKVRSIMRGLERESLKVNEAVGGVGLQNMNVDSGWAPQKIITDFLLKRDDPENELDTLENAVGLGNVPQATEQFAKLMMTSFSGLNLDDMEGYLTGLTDYSQKNTLPGMESVDWETQKGQLANFKKMTSLLTETSKPTTDQRSDHKAIADSVREEIKFLKQSRAPQEAIQAAELRLETWLKDPNAMKDGVSPEAAKDTHDSMKQAAKIMSQRVGDPNFVQNISRANLEFERLKQRFQTAEQTKDYGGALEILAAIEAFYKQPDHEIFKLALSESWIQEQRLEYRLRVVAQPVADRLPDLLLSQDYEGARRLVLDFEAGLAPEFREMASAKRMIAIWSDLVKNAPVELGRMMKQQNQ